MGPQEGSDEQSAVEEHCLEIEYRRDIILSHEYEVKYIKFHPLDIKTDESLAVFKQQINPHISFNIMLS